MAPLYVVHGDEHLLVLEAVDRLRRTAREAGFSERDVLVAERGFHWSQLVEAQQSMSLFGDRKIVELRNTNRQARQGWRRGATRRGGPAVPGRGDARHAAPARLRDVQVGVVRALESAGVSIKVDAVDRTRLPAWVGERLGLQQQRVEPGEAGRRALQFIADKVEGNLLAAHEEIQSSACCTRPASLPSTRCTMRCSTWPATTSSSCPRRCSAAMCRASRACSKGCAARAGHGLVLWALTEEIRVLSKVRQGLAAGKPAGVLMRRVARLGPARAAGAAGRAAVVAATVEAALAMAARLEPAESRACPTCRGAGGPGGNLPAEPWDGLLQLALMIARPA